MIKQGLRGTKILAWIIIILAVNEFITYIGGIYVGNNLEDLREFLHNYLTLFSPILYFVNLLPLHNLYELTDKGKAIIIDRLFSCLPIIYTILFFISATGILRFKNWARRLTIFSLFLLLTAMSVSFNLRYHTTGDTILHLFKTLILIYPIIYLTRPKVSEQFK